MRREYAWLRSLSLAALVGMVSSGCGSSDESGSAPQNSPSAPVEREASAKPSGRSADEEAGTAAEQMAATAAGSATSAAAGAAVPAASRSADPERGRVLYERNCASCHGQRGAGDGPVGQALVPKPARHNDGEYMNALSNEHVFKVIEQGGGAVGKSALMAPWSGVLSDDQIWDVVAFIRTLAEPAYSGPMP
jgi:mono/diheme cytochrome c family protein